MFTSAKNGIIEIDESLLRYGVQKDKEWLMNQALEQIMIDPSIFQPLGEIFELDEIYGVIKRSMFDQIQ